MTSAVYMKDEAIPPNTVQVTGGSAKSFSITPALPLGLSMNTGTGTISGTPTELQPQTTYTITASNSAGTAKVQVLISVTGRGSWSMVQDIPGGRHYAASVRLNDGNILVAGGLDASGPTSSAVIYNPVSNNWTPAAPLLYARQDPSATVLSDGRVLVIGGETTGGATLSSAEIYDPAANTWTATGSMAKSRVRHTATPLPNGKVLVTGGYQRLPFLSFIQSAEIYDPASGTWALMKTILSTPRAQHTGQLLLDGKTLLLIGGVNNLGFVTSAELFPVDDSGSSSLLPGVVQGGNVYTSVLLTDGSVLAMSDNSVQSIRFYPITSTWTTSSLASGTARALPTMNTLNDGRVLLAGGGNLATSEIYNPDLNLWTSAASMVTPRRAATANLLTDGSVLVIGGFNSTGSISSVERFTP
ncbi:putative Ig domain-containing protein [Comamonas thiooxydans]|nr:putative Ig domain-containing protein [Comamonas thiooxydans]